jgi:hypothetical protein
MQGGNIEGTSRPRVGMSQEVAGMSRAHGGMSRALGGMSQQALGTSQLENPIISQGASSSGMHATDI